MKKKQIIYALLVLSVNVYSQTYSSRTAFIGFYSKTPLEDITAENNQSFAIIDFTKKQLAVAALLKGFEFKKELMQTHFNENYVESDKYPKASFSGSINTIIKTDTGQLEVQVTGNLMLHGVTKNITIPATLKISNGKLIGYAVFTIKPADYNISVPAIVRDKIATEINVEVKLTADEIKK